MASHMNKVAEKIAIIGILLWALWMMAGCAGTEVGNPEEGSAAMSDAVTISGAVQKGPFIVGTTVYVNLLDDFGKASTSTANAEIDDSIGSFFFDLDEPGPVQIVSTGYYFNEVTGRISNDALELTAIYVPNGEGEQTANVNILTHLIHDRVLKLIENGGMTIKDAIVQAQSEFIAELNPILPVESIADFNLLSLYNMTSDNHLGNAYLLALSAAFFKYAQVKAQDRNTSADAQLVLILAVVSKDFAEDGLIQLNGFKTDLVAALSSLNPSEIEENLRERSSIDYSTPLDVPDISIFVTSVTE